MRGIALVGLVDAILIGIALVIIGVPLVVPIMIITFFAAFVPLIGAFVAGLVAVLIALVSGGLVDALLVLGAIILVQQVEGHVLYPLLMSRTVNLHPAVIVVALATGGILGGIVGVFLAVPVAGIVSVVLDFARDRPAPESPLLDEPASGLRTDVLAVAPPAGRRHGASQPSGARLRARWRVRSACHRPRDGARGTGPRGCSHDRGGGGARSRG